MTSWWKIAAGSSGKKRILIHRSIIYILNFWQFKRIQISNKGWKKHERWLILCKNKIVGWHLHRRLLTVALRATEFENWSESNQCSFSGYVGMSGFHWKESNVLFGNRVTENKHMLIKTLIYEMQTTVWENKRFHCKEISQTFLLFLFSDPETLRRNKRFTKLYHPMIFQIW